MKERRHLSDGSLSLKKAGSLVMGFSESFVIVIKGLNIPRLSLFVSPVAFPHRAKLRCHVTQGKWCIFSRETGH